VLLRDALLASADCGSRSKLREPVSRFHEGRIGGPSGQVAVACVWLYAEPCKKCRRAKPRASSSKASNTP
jgi:hypothetical protein